MIIRRRFRPLGKLLQRFGRGQINNYTHTTNMASRAEVPPVWEEDAQQPLVWSDPDVNPEPADVSSEAAPAPAVQRRSSVQRKAQPAPAPTPAASAPTPADSGQRRTPPDLWKIHDLHTQMLEEEGYRMPPSPWAKPVDPATASRLPSPPSNLDTPVQRRARTPAAQPTPSSSQPSTPATPAPPTISGRRRGRVIEEKTPQQEENGESGLLPDNDLPSWETEIADEADRPDLFEALMSEGVVQRRDDPDLSAAETFAPQFRPSPPEVPADRPAPANVPDAPDAPASRTPSVQRSEASQPPRTERDVQTPPATPPVQPRSSSPSSVQRQSAPPDTASEYDMTDDADMPASLVPAPGTTEADLLDMLGLPPDTPVRGLNPAAAMPPAASSSSTPQASAPSTPVSSSAPAAPVQRQTAPPGVQRTESTSPAQTTSTPANPTPPARQRVNVPPTSPYRSQTTGEPITPDDVADSESAYTAPTSLSNPTIMRQPEMADAQTDEPEFSDFDEGDDSGEWSEPPAVANFTSFFEAAEAAVTGNDWPINTPDEPEPATWSQPEPPSTIAQPGMNLPRANPFPTTPPSASISSSAPTRPTPRVQRAPADADLPYIDEDADAPESYDDFEDTQPIDLPFTSSSAPTPEASRRSRSTLTSETDSPGRVQRAAVPPAETAGESYPRAVDPSLIDEMAQSEIPYSWSASDEVEAQSPEFDSQPSQTTTPRQNRPGSRPQTPSVQRAESPQSAPSQPESGDSNRSITPVGYHIEGLPESRGTAPTGQVSRAKSGDKTMGGDKLGGKTTPQGMSMALPSKTSTDMVSNAVTAPSSGSSASGGSKTGGKTSGGSDMSGKAGGGDAYMGGKTDPGSAPPQNTSSDWSSAALPVDEAASSSSGGSPPDSSSESGDASPDSAPGGQNDVDKLARDVYNLLRDRLRVEQERRTKR